MVVTDSWSSYVGDAVNIPWEVLANVTGCAVVAVLMAALSFRAIAEQRKDAVKALNAIVERFIKEVDRIGASIQAANAELKETLQDLTREVRISNKRVEK